MTEKYALSDDPSKTMFVFEKNGKVYGHIIKNRTDKAPAKFIFETEKYDSIEALKAAYPEAIG
jgi:FAD synthase